MIQPVTTKWFLPVEPYQGPERCSVCVGAKVTGDKFTFGEPGPDGRQTLVDLLCDQCGGCGRADHTDCSPGDHVGDDQDDDDRYDEDDAPDRQQACLSCNGRLYWVAQGFSETEVHHLRVPCGCAAALMRQGTETP